MKEIQLKNGEKLIIDRAKKEDAPDIIDYLNIVFGESDNLLRGKNGCTFTIEQEEEFIENIRKSQNSIMLCNRINEKVASVSTLSSPSIERIAHTSELAISVKKEFWGIGAGSAVMSQIIDFAKNTNKIKIISLGVRVGNESAIHLYKKFGFEEIGVYKKFFNIKGTYHDEILMNLYL